MRRVETVGGRAGEANPGRGVGDVAHAGYPPAVVAETHPAAAQFKPLVVEFGVADDGVVVSRLDFGDSADVGTLEPGGYVGGGDQLTDAVGQEIGQHRFIVARGNGFAVGFDGFGQVGRNRIGHYWPPI